MLKLETRALGRSHAREHRRARREARLLAKLLGPPAPPPRRPRRSMAIGAPDQVGQWSATSHIDVTGIHAVTLPTGKVLFFNYGPNETGIATLWDPQTKTGKRIDPPGGDNLWCGGQTLLPDGRVMVAGGNIPKLPNNDNFRGLDTIYTFNPWTEKWLFEGRMSGGRWYPTTTLLPDGRVIITSGLDAGGASTINYDVELFTPNPDPTKPGTIESVGYSDLNLYPLQHLVRDGRVVVSGPMMVDVGIFNTSSWTYSSLAQKPSGNHYYGSAVLLPDGPNGSSKVMVIGGNQQTATEVLDAENLGAGWTSRAPLPQARRNANSVLTPDGAIITVGGNIDGNYGQPQKEALRYDPAANAWTSLADQTESRGYHSTALLLPDGRIVSAGDDGPDGGGGQNDQIEIFSPPYLFKGARPVISSAPGEISYGAAFDVSAQGDVARAVLIAPGATTHANDMHQRLVPLAMTPIGGGVRLTAPPSSNVAPPGYYMLFLVDSAGVPSVARFVRLSTSAPASGGAASPGGAAGTAPALLVPKARTVLAPLAPRSYWREGFENPLLGIPNAARVGAAYTGRKALWVGSGAVVPGPALRAGTYRATLRVRNGGVRLGATVKRRTMTLALAAKPGPARWRPVTDTVRFGPSGAVRVRLKVEGGWAIADDLVLKRQ
jgi:Domain of unknown function (DUF1929)